MGKTFFGVVVMVGLLMPACSGSGAGNEDNLAKMTEHKNAICNAKTTEDQKKAKAEYEAFSAKQSTINWAHTTDAATKEKLGGISQKLLRCYNKEF